MDPWKEYAAWEECRDAVRQWAELEGKSPQMSEDLVREAHRATQSVDAPFVLAAGVRFAAWVLETWWHMTRR